MKKSSRSSTSSGSYNSIDATSHWKRTVPKYHSKSVYMLPGRKRSTSDGGLFLRNGVVSQVPSLIDTMIIMYAEVFATRSTLLYIQYC